MNTQRRTTQAPEAAEVDGVRVAPELPCYWGLKQQGDVVAWACAHDVQAEQMHRCQHSLALAEGPLLLCCQAQVQAAESAVCLAALHLVLLRSKGVQGQRGTIEQQ
jgi:hypothetical protein